MNIVVTGAKGFIGKNLCVMLSEKGYDSVKYIDKDTSKNEIEHALDTADFVYHLAGINRPIDESEFTEGNANFTEFVLNRLKSNDRNTPVMLSSSIQANLDNAYGASKAKAEALVSKYGSETGASTFIYRFPNVFGKWCRPNYNSFVATFCHNIVNDIDINIHDRSAPVTLVYIDDVCKVLIGLLDGGVESGLKQVPMEYNTTVGQVADLLQAFSDSRVNLVTEHVGNGLTRALYSTYLSYFEPSKFHYTLPKYGDERGVFCEMLKTKESGQFSFFTAHKGITRGGHYHHSKNEKFLVIKGEALFKFEHVVTGERYELTVNSEEATVVETVPGWSHAVTNVGDDELIVMLWANEVFDRDAPDTIAKPL
ncbi:UDP-2-acetamido-2,6-beta-L-arabino-hexul-4-ose reductase [Photobacterium lutimaris]|uniref:Capsular biosynthesis protein n=1 Tax=Photobacterium lutimaris TaxID=388278 RepID=A0A2T3IXB2_9GAMM|nr:NAD-dependent epimerase/dehydratase family protein [Photobacterium lutimaris]PSU33170.1 capsular biosynthesis protein [Photobacterium lutimaris]TDR75254.1 UDP-2-acetamido-2,6-beta-L-arabino-hexul-4-ose reductase [Photobacterium lutimaris]